MTRSFVEKDFKMEIFEDFYESHYFQPVSDEEAVNAHRIFPRVAWALDIAKEIKPKRVLDLGCLEGYALLTVANHVDSVTYGAGVDLSQDGIDMARKRVKLVGKKLDFTKGSIEDFLKMTAVKYDMVMLFEVIEHVKDPAAVLKAIDNVLAPGGTVLISTPAFESPTFGKTDTINKCHIRLYTLKDEDYEETFIDKQPASETFGEPVTRKATSIFKEIGYGDAKRGHERTISAEVLSQLINIRYT